MLKELGRLLKGQEQDSCSKPPETAGKREENLILSFDSTY
ncbi:Hypothetical protein Minf_2054 [Methylacidiphilum infernorum V4]|uniref:Uncharacterized protein n=1 Tax=Methylacidiphilum infernorum (isolate V4) TaxID=481448 RepID=B3DZ16_METI4|nr:Hypothetical protein Minf_2054 [Methylacidiphilum infernorum V4]